MMRVSTLLSFSLLLMVRCASTPSPAATAIREADDRMVADCQYVGDVQGSSMLSAAAGATGRANAKTQALEEAARLRATHVVWVSVTTVNQGGSSAHGKAYRCDGR